MHHFKNILRRRLLLVVGSEEWLNEEVGGRDRWCVESMLSFIHCLFLWFITWMYCRGISKESFSINEGTSEEHLGGNQ